MNCLPCFNNDDDEEVTDPPPPNKGTPTSIDAAKEAAASSSKAKTFTFRELAMATKNFRQECLLGEGGFGRVFKGKLHSTGQVVAVKQLDRNGMQGNKEFLVEVLMLSLIQHTNLVSLIGYCADGDQRLLVYEYLSMGSLENQLFGDDPEKKPMDWFTRMKIASGAANGLEYLHDKANPPIIYRDLKPSNILLDENYEPKLSDFGLAKLGAGGGRMTPASRVMGTYGYSAPEYSSGGEHTLKSDIYSFGVVLLELITGRRAIDTTRPNNEQNLVTWAQPIFRDPKRFPDLADPKLNNAFPVTSLNQAVGICAMCLQEEPAVRPLISDVVAALSFLAIPQPITAPASDSPSTHSPPSEQKMQYETEMNLSEEAPQSEPGSSVYDDRSSGHSESSVIEDESVSVSDPPNEGSSESYSVGEKSGSSQYSERESECLDSDRRHSSDISEEQLIYTSDSDSGGEDITYDDADTRELDDTERSTDSTANESLYSAKSNDSSLNSDAGNKSSKHGSSRRPSPTNKTGSRRRKPVVTFKEPSLSGKKHGTIKPKEETSSSDNTSNSINKVNNENFDNDKKQTVLPAATDSKKQQSSSSSSSESSSESEDERSPEKDERRSQIQDERSLKQDERRSPKLDERRSPKQDKRRSPKQDERRSPKQDERRSPKQDERRSPKQDERRSPKQDVRRSPKLDERRSPKQDQRRSPKQDERRSPKQDKRRSPKQDEKSSEQDERSPRHEENTQKSRPKNASQGEDIPSIDKIEANHRVFEQVAKKDGPKLRHLKTR